MIVGTPEHTATHPLPLYEDMKCGVAIWGGVTEDSLGALVDRTRAAFEDVGSRNNGLHRDCIAFAVNMNPVDEYGVDVALIATAMGVNGGTHTLSREACQEAVGEPRAIWTGENDTSHMRLIKVVGQVVMSDGSQEEGIVYSLFLANGSSEGKEE